MGNSNLHPCKKIRRNRFSFDEDLDEGLVFFDKKGMSPLMVAAGLGQLDVVKFLLYHGATLENEDNENFKVEHYGFLGDLCEGMRNPGNKSKIRTFPISEELWRWGSDFPPPNYQQLVRSYNRIHKTNYGDRGANSQSGESPILSVNWDGAKLQQRRFEINVEVAAEIEHAASLGLTLSLYRRRRAVRLCRNQYFYSKFEVEKHAMLTSSISFLARADENMRIESEMIALSRADGDGFRPLVFARDLTPIPDAELERHYTQILRQVRRLQSDLDLYVRDLGKKNDNRTIRLLVETETVLRGFAREFEDSLLKLNAKADICVPPGGGGEGGERWASSNPSAPPDSSMPRSCAIEGGGVGSPPPLAVAVAVAAERSAKKKCRFADSPGGCRNGSECKFSHGK